MVQSYYDRTNTFHYSVHFRVVFSVAYVSTFQVALDTELFPYELLIHFELVGLSQKKELENVFVKHYAPNHMPDPKGEWSLKENN